MSHNSLVFIQGPTATGKSELAIELAEKVNGVVVNCDSLQVYKDLNIGTAKPSQKDRERVPHYLFDFLAVNGTYTAGEYMKVAHKVIAGVIEKHNVFVVGGTGFYFKALEYGMYEIEPVSDEVLLKLRNDLDAKGLEYLYAELAAGDPESAEEISPGDSYRVFRALSVLRSGQKMSQVKKAHEEKGKAITQNIVKIGLDLPRERLREIVERRTEKMFEAGLVDEVRNLLAVSTSDWPPLQSIGYKEVVAYLKGELTREDLFEEVVKNTMRLAKRQKTWFKKDKEVRWFDAIEERSLILDYLQNQLQEVKQS